MFGYIGNISFLEIDSEIIHKCEINQNNKFSDCEFIAMNHENFKFAVRAGFKKTSLAKVEKPIKQPIEIGDWIISYVGNIVNFNECKHIFEKDSLGVFAVEKFAKEAKGGFSAIFFHIPSERLFFAITSKPLFYKKGKDIVYFNSEKIGDDWVNFPQYSYGGFHEKSYTSRSIFEDKTKVRVLAICSGGMDSTTALADVINNGHEVEIIHFDYKCKAASKERQAVENIAKYYGIKAHFIPMNFYDNLKCVLTDKNAEISNGIDGAKFGKEWVPARNLVMLSIATAFAENHGFNRICLGTNLEESEAYPDNEPEFIRQFNKVLPFSVKNGDMVVWQPVGNLTKSEIVKKALDLRVPLHLTWSCYHDGETPCGDCNSCFMRKMAFEENGLRGC